MQFLPYTKKQEIANSITHGLGIVLSVVGIPILFTVAVEQNLPEPHWVALVVYWVSLLMVYVSSTLYHAFTHKKVKRKLQVLDHISIYFLIAGTTTSFVVRYVDSSTATIFLVIQWSLVVLGTLFKLFYTGRFEILSTMFYLGLGLMVLFIVKSLWVSMPVEVFSWIVVGGLCYVGGIIFYLWKRLYYQHAIWHIFVLGGSISHFVALVCSF